METSEPDSHESVGRLSAGQGKELDVGKVHPAELDSEDAHWLRMDPSITRAVLAKTEEELLGGLAALMRNKVEHEQVSRMLAQVQIYAAEAKHELDAIRQQVRRAEEEVATRINEQSRIGEEITSVRRELATLREEHRHRLEVVSGLKNDAAQAQQLLAEADQRLASVKVEAGAKLAEHRDVT